MVVCIIAFVPMRLSPALHSPHNLSEGLTLDHASRYTMLSEVRAKNDFKPLQKPVGRRTRAETSDQLASPSGRSAYIFLVLEPASSLGNATNSRGWIAVYVIPLILARRWSAFPLKGLSCACKSLQCVKPSDRTM